MKRIFLSVIALAIAVPAIMLATEKTYDYTQVTPLLTQVETHIEDGDITFDTDAHKQTFLNGIQAVYDYRDAENWSFCVTICDSLASKALDWIENDTIAENTNEVCAAVGDIYEEDNPVIFDVCSISSEDEEDIDDGLEGLLSIRIELFGRHAPGCIHSIGIRVVIPFG